MKNYLVIGGSSGIGKEISELLSNENIVFSFYTKPVADPEGIFTIPGFRPDW